MAVASPSSPKTLDPKSDKPDASSEKPNPDPSSQSGNPNPDPNPNQNANPNANPNIVAPPPPSFAPSFRPLGAPPMPQYSAVPNPNPSIQPPGVSAPVTYMIPGVASGAGSVTVSAPPMRYPPPGAPPMAYGQVPNGYMTGHPPGIPRYPGPYPPMIRPGFPPRPLPPMGVIPQILRPPIPGIRGPPVVSPVVRPVVPAVATEKPQTTVYVSKIAPTVDNDFLLSLLRLCGPVKSWKRAQNPSDGSPTSFGFCEFEAAEGILRALRLLTKLNIDGQELGLKINQATREYLERYVQKKTEQEKLKATENQAPEKENEGAPGVEKQELQKPAVEGRSEEPDDSGDKENQEHQTFGIVTDEDREADKDASEKITSKIEERLKTKPLPPPPPVRPPVDASVKSNSEVPSKSREVDSEVDIVRSDVAEDKNDDETTSEAKASSEHDKVETSSPDRGRRHDRSSRERDREHDLKREKERELERYERERERERVRREKERDLKIREAERLYNNRLKDWEAREREKEHRRQKEKEREKDRQRERRREISKDEDGSDDDEDDTRKRRRRSTTLEEKRRKRQREKEDDLADRLKEEEEIAEAKKRAIEEQRRMEETKALPDQVNEDREATEMQVDAMVIDGEATYENSIGGELTAGSAALTDMKQNNDVPARKLGFGLMGSGKRTTVPSVFREEDENVEEKKMRPLVPIDYSTEELQAVQSSVSSTPPNLVAAAEFAKRISGENSKEEKPEMERNRNGRSNDRSSHKERVRNEDENARHRNDNKEKTRDRSYEREREREDKPKSENKKLLDAKQLIDMIPKTKEELFAYEINWDVYDKHELHEKMRPWISKKITEFLGEEEETLVDYIVSSTKEHVQASKMLNLLKSILDDEAEMFVLKMWRMLIFEIKRVETGISVKPRA
ncbi:RNA-binding protein 25 isoform X2 [Asparagus officinalis]|uniref:RNA-binding protein 25 isoform X2 n=1 Tax=Asparagus officinalis TaxID=4686 RepID=UPI00098E764B|nr:RNA-binding protein 25 isoform X2 [Asparagus officinalis]